MKPHTRARLRYQLYALETQQLKQLAIQVQPIPRPLFRSTWVKFTSALVILATLLSLPYIDIDGIFQNLAIVWGIYAFYLDLVIVHRSIKRLRAPNNFA
jgi:hypothetical protein